MAAIPFAKVEGLGNDFIVIDLRAGKAAAPLVPVATLPGLARALCDRHLGVGADGILAVMDGDKGDARMRVINADGSEAEMCGNGIRCVAKLLYERDSTLRRPILRIDTGAGLLECAMDVDAASGRVSGVSVDMGRPRLEKGEIPMTGPPRERAVRSRVTIADRTFSFTAVSMGNPHAVIFVDDPAADLRAMASTYGPSIETHPLFPRRTNVELARLPPGRKDIELVVWERGCGITLACGTGACATAVAACLESRAGAGAEIPVHLPGGTLHITVRPEGAAGEPVYAGVRMRGPAQVVFDAEVDPAAVRAISLKTM